MKILKKNQIEEALNRMADQAEVFVPLQRETQTGFYPWKSYDNTTDTLVLDELNVSLPPKQVVFPQTDKMYSFKQNGVEIDIDKVYEEIEPQVVFGIRACDLQGIACLDLVFLTKGYEDNFYKARRDNLTIVAQACYKPGKACFCSSMGVDPVHPQADVIISDLGDEGYAWEDKTEKGQALTEKIANLLEEKEAKLPEPQDFTLKVEYDGVAEKLKEMFEHPIWEQLSEPCQTCGICTYLCPTCHCFDIQVKTWGDEGYRFRCYDSCMYEEYTREAGGGNPRGKVSERFRNRFLHKLEFFQERYGTPLCTGCGRCIIACPTGISIVQLIEKIKEADTGA